ncbi:hypothetical protein [Streptomyces rimosus]|uniref:hypothetical protein n=1 Tax=Streptomyces rimosus TaxID=1927 RepID=UPI0037D7A4A6
MILAVGARLLASRREFTDDDLLVHALSGTGGLVLPYLLLRSSGGGRTAGSCP